MVSDATMTKATPVTPHVDEGGPVGVVVRVELHEDCEAVNPPLNICLDVWDTRTCHTNDPNCQGSIKINRHATESGGWEPATGRMICNKNFLLADARFDPPTVVTAVNLWILVLGDSVRSDRQDHVIITMYDPFRYLRIPIRDID